VTAGASAVQAARDVVDGVDQRVMLGKEVSKDVWRKAKRTELERRRQALRKTERRRAERKEAIRMLDARAKVRKARRENGPQERTVKNKNKNARFATANDGGGSGGGGGDDDSGTGGGGGGEQRSDAAATTTASAVDGIVSGSLAIAGLGAGALSAALNASETASGGRASAASTTTLGGQLVALDGTYDPMRGFADVESRFVAI
jgi:hypothetical protein